MDETLVAEQIARRLGCAPITVLRTLRRFQIPVRSVGPAPRRANQLPLWSPKLAYAIGLITTDGNLSLDGRHLAVPSIDRDLLESIRDCLTLRNRIVRHTNRSGFIYRLQWGDRAFYDWLVSIGLTPAKSLTLGPLAIPATYFADFFRGCIDGDGSIVVYTDRHHTAMCERYVYERLYVSLVSASPAFISWVHRSVQGLVGVKGAIDVRTTRWNPLWRLRYAKAESIQLLRWMYYASDVPALERKRRLAAPFLVPRLRPHRRGPGRPVVL